MKKEKKYEIRVLNEIIRNNMNLQKEYEPSKKYTNYELQVSKKKIWICECRKVSFRIRIPLILCRNMNSANDSFILN